MSISIRPVNELIKEFNRHVFDLIARGEKRATSEITVARFDRTRKRISLLKSTYGDHGPIHQAYTFFLEYALRILEPDMQKRETFFLELNIRDEYLKRNPDVKKISATDEFLFDLTDNIREMYKSVEEKEKLEIYNVVNKMLQCSIEYNQHIRKKI